MGDFIAPGLPRPGEAVSAWYRRGQERAIAVRREAGEPWQEIGGRYNRWKDTCKTCGGEVDFGWDDGFGWPDGGRIEAECEDCGAVMHYTWDMSITVNKCEEFEEGKAPPSRDERGRFASTRAKLRAEPIH